MSEIDALEKKIYDRYYELNPKGDARFRVWPKVIDAKKKQDPIAALKKVLEWVEKGGR